MTTWACPYHASSEIRRLTWFPWSGGRANGFVTLGTLQPTSHGAGVQRQAIVHGHGVKRRTQAQHRQVGVQYRSRTTLHPHCEPNSPAGAHVSFRHGG